MFAEPARRLLLPACTAEMVDFSDPKRRPRYLSKLVMAALLTAMCVLMLTQPPCHRRAAPSVVIYIHEYLFFLLLLLFHHYALCFGSG
jgi:hypothetical protein